MLRALRRRLAPRIALDPSLGTDDFDWSLYHLDYRAQIEVLAKDILQRLEAGDAVFEAGKLHMRRVASPLHPNHATLYETIGVLAPRSVIEIGCGGGDHLHNLGILYPTLQRRGFDRSPAQLAFLRERSPQLAPLTHILDITMPPAEDTPTADVVYTQAVLMHIQAGNGHLVALHNMFRMALKQIVLMENWKRHRFVDDIRLLHECGMLAWAPRFYFRRWAGRPHILVVSREPLDLDPLQDYQQLLEPLG